MQSRKAQPDERGESMTTPLDRLHVEGGVVLRSSNVEVVVVSHEGGRIASLRSVQSGLESLPRREKVVRRLAKFEEYFPKWSMRRRRGMSSDGWPVRGPLRRPSS